jgi:streptogramin lyase
MNTVNKTNYINRLAGNLWGVLLTLAVLPLAVLGQANYANPYTFTTFAGNTGYGSADGTGPAARFAVPYDVAVDSAGNVYVADSVNNTIRQVTPAGVVTTIAGLAGYGGSADGTNNGAQFDFPAGVVVDGKGNLYVTDVCNHTIRKATPVGTNWVVTTLAGQPGVSGNADGTNDAAQFNSPGGVAVDGAGNLYVADTYSDTIRKVTPVGTNWVVTTIAGKAGVSGSNNGIGTNAEFDWPEFVAVDSATNVYVTDALNDTIRKLTPDGTNWQVTTLAGLAGSPGTNDGTGASARFDIPTGIGLDSSGNLYVAEYVSSVIRHVTPEGVVTRIAGQPDDYGTNNGPGSAAQFYGPYGLTLDSATNVYVADTLNNMIRQVTPTGTSWVVTTLAGLKTVGAGSVDGTGTNAQFNEPIGVAVDGAGNVYVGDYGNDTIRRVTPAGVVTTLAGQADSPGSQDGTGTNAQFNEPDGVAVDSATNVYVGDYGNHTIRMITPSGTNWNVTTLAGEAGNPGFEDGMPGQFDYPNGVAVDTNGNVYVADTGNRAIRFVTPAGYVTTPSTDFSGPTGVAVGPDGNIYVADYYSYTIRKMTPAGAVTILAGLAGTSGTADGTNSGARFNNPYGIVVDSAGNLYVGDRGNNTIRKVTPVGTTWVVTTLGGIPEIHGSADGTGRVARLWGPCCVALDSAGNLYVADLSNNTIRKGFPASAVPAPSLQAPSLRVGQFGFGVTGLPNLAVGIESSGNLFQWQTIGTCTLTGGTNYFVSPNPPQGAQFYRSLVR